MKLLKFKGSFVFFLLITLLLTGCSFKEKVENKSDVYSYLEENKKVIMEKTLSTSSSLSIMNSDLSDKEIFLTGEWSGVKANYVMNMKFLKYFKEKADIKYYLCDIPYSYAYLLNTFLETGNLEILDMIYEPLYGSRIWSKDEYTTWIELYNYNNTLTEDKKITIVGIGLEYNDDIALSFMDFITSETAIPDEISGAINDLKSIFLTEKSYTETEIKNICENIKTDIEVKQDVYRKFLGENFLGFKLVNDNLLNYIESYHLRNSIDKSHKFSAEKLYENFKQQYEILEKGKYYGSLLISDIYQNEQDNTKRLAAQINEGIPSLRNKMLSIAYVYDNCEYMIKGTEYTTSTLNTFDQVLNNLEGIATENYTLFKLNGKNSPFNNQLIWLTSGSDRTPNSKNTTDYYQYLVVIRNSKASDPLTGAEK